MEDISIYGYYQENTGVQIYTRKLHEELDADIVEPSKLLRPRALNQFLFNPSKIKRLDSDIIHLANQDDLSTVLPFPSIDKLVVTVHDIFRFHGESGRLDKIRGRRYLNNIEKHADKVIAISEFTKEELLEHTSVPEEKIEVIYQGVDKEKFRPEGEVEYSSYLLHVGTEIPRKNIEGLIKIFSRVKEKRPELKLVRIGELTDKTEKIIEEEGLKLGEDIIYEDNVSFSRLKALYTNAEKLAFPSHAEGFGRPIVESLACDTPVIAFNKKPMSEILDEKMLAENNDEFVEKLCKDIEGEFRGLVDRFDWSKTAEETKKVYRGLQ